MWVVAAVMSAVPVLIRILPWGDPLGAKFHDRSLLLVAGNVHNVNEKRNGENCRVDTDDAVGHGQLDRETKVVIRPSDTQACGFAPNGQVTVRLLRVPRDYGQWGHRQHYQSKSLRQPRPSPSISRIVAVWAVDDGGGVGNCGRV